MDQVQTIVNDVVGTTETVLNRGLDNVYISTTIKVLIGLYAAFAAPKLPPSLVDLMDNVIVRVAFAFVIVLTATRDPSIALMIAIAFIVTLQTANKFRLINTELSVAAPGQSSWLPSAKTEGFEDDLLAEEDAENEPTGEKEQSPVEDEGEGDDEDAEEDPEHFSPYFRASRKEDFQVMQGSNISGNVETDPAAAFTTEQHLVSAQSNNVDSSDQLSCHTTMANQHCTQGLTLNGPTGA